MISEHDRVLVFVACSKSANVCTCMLVTGSGLRLGYSRHPTIRSDHNVARDLKTWKPVRKEDRQGRKQRTINGKHIKPRKP